MRLEIQKAEEKSARKSGSVRLCAVSKFHPAEAVLAALKAKQTLFGENRVQEAVAKFTGLDQKSAEGKNIELHIIGSLQTNKVKKALTVATCVQSVDREELLQEIEKHAANMGKTVSVFFEIHTGEESKAGYADLRALNTSLEHCALGVYPHIKPAGLMTMAPFTQDESAIRKSFSSVRLLKEEINKNFPSLPIRELSMGMSSDFKIAIEEGSTMVRIGTALFGERSMGQAV